MEPGVSMDIQGKWALVTGASAGIGKACAQMLARHGVNLVLVARRQDRLQVLGQELTTGFGVTVESVPLDVRDRMAVTAFCGELRAKGRPLDILVNAAGLARGSEKMHEGSVDDWEEMIDTNMKGVLYLVRGLVPHMVTSAEAPWVVTIGSTAGLQAYAGGGVYCGTKAAVGFLGDGLRIDTVDTKLRVCTIKPGMVETEFSVVRFHGDQQRANRVYQGMDPLHAEDVAAAVEFVVTRPAHVQVADMTIMPTCQASPTVVHRT